MKVRIDNSGNIMFGDDQATTSAKNMILYLISVLAKSDDGITYDENSTIKDIEYQNGQISWLEGGSTQTYSYGTADLQAFLTDCFTNAYPEQQPGVTLEQMEQLLGVTYGESSISDIIHADTGLEEGETVASLIKARPTAEDITTALEPVAKSAEIETLSGSIEALPGDIATKVTKKLGDKLDSIQKTAKQSRDFTVAGAALNTVLEVAK